MWNVIFRLAILISTATILSNCANAVDAASRILFGTAETLSARLEVTPANGRMGLGTNYQMTATLIAESGTRTTVTSSATWVSSNTSVATINSAGRASAAAMGTFQVAASTNGLNGTAGVSVLGLSGNAITITAPEANLPAGTTEQLTATITLSDGSTQDVTDQVTWNTGTGNLTVSPSGVATGVAVTGGGVPVTATGTFGGTAVSSTNPGGQSPSVTVTAAVLRHIQITPSTATVGVGATQQFTATGVYSDGTTINETASVTWASSSANATINAAGLATGVTGTTGDTTSNITATKNGISSNTSPGNSAVLTVKKLMSIAVSPSGTSQTPKGLTRQFTAAGTWSDGTTTDVTSQVTWTSSTGNATISNVGGSNGLATAAAVGQASITAALNGVDSSATGTVTFDITAANLVSIAVTPATPTKAVGAQQQFVATGTYTDNTTATITNTVTWSSLTTGVATISGTGLVTVVSAGTSTIQAVIGGITGSTVLTGSSVTISSIAVTPANPTLSSIGATQQFSATATYSDASTSDITSTCAWSSSDTGKATISNAGGSEGLATTVATGTTNITCTKSSVTSSPVAVLTVNGDTTPPTIASVTKIDNTHVKVTFAEGMKVGANEADDTASYKIATTVSGSCSDNSNFTGSAQTGDFSITGVAAGNSNTEFTLTLSGSLGNKNYYLLADKSKLEDNSTNALTCSNSKAFYGLDSDGAYLVSASQDGTIVTVTFSEDMKNGGGTVNDADNASNYSLSLLTGSCNVPTVSSVTKSDEKTFKLNLSASITGSCNFNVTAATTIKDKAVPTANTMGSPNALTFTSNLQLYMERAEAVAGTVTQIKLVFSKSVKTTSATCSDAATCATMYKIVPSLGNITSAVVQADGRSVILTHATNQKGMFYVVVAANLVNDDGFDNGISLRNSGDTENLQSIPFDRFAVLGNGESITTFDGGAYFEDPFGDLSKFVFVFTYGNQVYVGPNDKNTATFRFLPSGLNPNVGTFSFASPTCATYKGFGYVDIAGGKDLTTTPACGTTSGPIQEIGVVGFNQVRLNISSTPYEMLITGPLAVNIATQGRVWYTQDLDNLLDMKQTTVTGTNGVNSKSLQTIYGFDDLVFVGISSNHGTNAPVINRLSATASSGVVTLSASPFDLGANGIAYLGKAATASPRNPAQAAYSTSTVGVDSMLKTAFASTNILYVANNGGVVYLTDNATSGYKASSANSITVTNATPSALSGTTLVLAEFDGTGGINTTTGGGLGKIRPGERGYPIMMTYNNKIYMVRNVARGSTCTTPGGATGTEATDCFMSRPDHGEVWQCDPGVDGICAPGEWTKIISGTETAGGTDATNVPTRNSIGMFTANGNNLYVGFDSYDGDGKGMRVFKIASTSPSATNGSTMASAGWSSAGAAGFGLGDANRYIFGASSAVNGTENVIFIVLGDNVNPVKVYRQVN